MRTYKIKDLDPQLQGLYGMLRVLYPVDSADMRALEMVDAQGATSKKALEWFIIHLARDYMGRMLYQINSATEKVSPS